MHDYLWHHTSEEEAEQADGESEVCPVMPVFHHLQGVTFEINGAIKVHLVKGFHGYLAFAMVFRPILLAVELQIMLHWSPWKTSLVIFSRRYRGSQIPKGSEYGDTGEQGEEYPGEEPSIDLTGQVGWD